MTPLRTLILFALAGLALGMANANAARDGATALREVGKIDGPGGGLSVFTGTSGVAHNLFVGNGVSFGYTQARIVSVTADTGFYVNTVLCDQPLLGGLVRETLCSNALRFDLGDLDDRLNSPSGETYNANYPGLVANGGGGRDFIMSGPLPDTLHGDAGNDTLNGMSGDDKVFGDGGDDTITGLGGADQIDGGAGVDTANYPSAESITITLNDDVANDGQTDEEDRLRSVENVGGGQAGDRITGSSAANRLNGLKGGDRLFGLAGDDMLIGWTGNDTLEGADGADRLEGGDGNDTLDGGSGADVLLGGAGDDVLTGGSGVDRLEGGDGADRIYARDGSADLITCGAGVDTAYVTSADQVDETTCETIVLA